MPRYGYPEIVDMSNQLDVFEGDAEISQLELSEVAVKGPTDILERSRDCSSVETNTSDKVELYTRNV